MGPQEGGERLLLWQGEVARAGGCKGKPWSDWMGKAQHRARGGAMQGMSRGQLRARREQLMVCFRCG